MKKFLTLALTLLMTMAVLPIGVAEESAVQNNAASMPWNLLENAVSVEIGLHDSATSSVTMYDNDAALTMMDYLSYNSMRFPTYTYEEEAGFVGQWIRGDYTRNDEMTVTDVYAGELYLFSDGLLRLYFKDVPGANITATPVGFFADTEGFTEKVQKAYTENLGDTWGVSVYFLIEKTME